MTTQTIAEMDLARPAPALGELVSASEFARLLGISKRTLFRLRSRGCLPAPVEITTNIIRWRVAEVRDYITGLRPRKPRKRR